MTEILTKEDAATLIEDLRRRIEHHRFLYYVLDRPEITDAEFDRLFNELLKLEREFPELVMANSPTQKVGAPPSAEFKSVRHDIPMLSLSNAMSEDDLDRWQDRLARSLELTEAEANRLEYVCELKIDGLSVSLRYEKGLFLRGATRGSGDLGEDVTLNLKTISVLPDKLTAVADRGFPAELEVRGEVYMPITSFRRVNAELAEEGQPLFANPRNAASGALRQKDPRVTDRRKLSLWTYFAYVINDKSFVEPTTHEGSLQLLAALGLPVNEHRAVVRGVEGIKEFCRDWFERRHGLNYQTDGVVIKLNDRSLWPRLGTTAHSPRWAVAFKYPPEEEETLLENVEFDVGRTGAVTPVALLKAVQLAGTTVKRASLHNFEQIKRLDVRVGDTVVVRKAGEIIPEVVRVVLSKRPPDTHPLPEPECCPDCRQKLERNGSEVALRCLNLACPSQVQRRLEHWVSRAAMDIEGLGTVLIRHLLDAKLVANVADIYSLTVEDLIHLERMGQKSADKVIASIDASRKRNLSNLLCGLGIRHVGVQIAETLAERYGDLDALISADDLDDVEGVGPAIAEAIKQFFALDSNLQLISRLKEAGLRTNQPRSVASQSVVQTVAGKTFVITGTLTFERAEAEKLIKAHGGKVSSSVSKKTDYVLVGENPGSKLNKAKELGITILDEVKFQSLLEGG